MKKFRLQHPDDLVSRMFLMEYLRELDKQKLYDACNEYKQKKMFYRFYDENEKEMIDINWEYIIFEATMYELESLMEKFLDEIEEINEKDAKINEMLAEQQKSILIEKPAAILGVDGQPIKSDQG